MNYELLIAELGSDYRAYVTKQAGTQRALDTANEAATAAAIAHAAATELVAEYAGLIARLEEEAKAPSPEEIAARKARAKTALGKIGELK